MVSFYQYACGNIYIYVYIIYISVCVYECPQIIDRNTEVKALEPTLL